MPYVLRAQPFWHVLGAHALPTRNMLLLQFCAHYDMCLPTLSTSWVCCCCFFSPLTQRPKKLEACVCKAIRQFVVETSTYYSHGLRPCSHSVFCPTHLFKTLAHNGSLRSQWLLQCKRLVLYFTATPVQSVIVLYILVHAKLPRLTHNSARLLTFCVIRDRAFCSQEMAPECYPVCFFDFSRSYVFFFGGTQQHFM